MLMDKILADSSIHFEDLLRYLRLDITYSMAAEVLRRLKIRHNVFFRQTACF